MPDKWSLATPIREGREEIQRVPIDKIELYLVFKSYVEDHLNRQSPTSNLIGRN